MAGRYCRAIAGGTSILSQSHGKVDVSRKKNSLHDSRWFTKESVSRRALSSFKPLANRAGRRYLQNLSVSACFTNLITFIPCVCCAKCFNIAKQLPLFSCNNMHNNAVTRTCRAKISALFAKKIASVSISANGILEKGREKMNGR